MYDYKINNDRPANTSLVDPSMDWKEALNIVDTMVRQNLEERNCYLLDLNCRAILDQYSPNQLISAWMIVSRGYSDRK
tara:strand:+ start:3058 stop:3291 length:234 start_codon:yes stop_codon:yes gene_type:complete